MPARLGLSGLKDIRLAVTLEQWNGARGRAWYRWLTAELLRALRW